MCMHTHVGTSGHYNRVIDISPNPTCRPCISQCPSWATPVKKKVWTRLWHPHHMYVTVCLSQTKFSFTLSLAAATGQTSACTASQSLLSLSLSAHSNSHSNKRDKKKFQVISRSYTWGQQVYVSNRLLFRMDVFFQSKKFKCRTPAACQYYQLYSNHRALKAGQQLSSTAILTTISHTFKSKNANYPFKKPNYQNKHCDAL